MRTPSNKLPALALWMVAVCAMWAAPAECAPLPSDEDRAEKLFKDAEQRVVRGQQGHAISTLATIVNDYRDTTYAARAQFRIGQLYDYNGENANAFEAYQVVMDWFIASSYYQQAMDAQIRIAKRVMDAYRVREREGEERVPVPLKDRETASRMLRIILENGRFTPQAPEIQYQLAVALEKEDWPRTAKEEHEIFLENYPRHHLADDAAFQIGYINYKLCEERNREATYRTQAQMAFLYLSNGYPDSPKLPLAMRLLAELDGLEFDSLGDAAAYYEKRGNAKAAAIYHLDMKKRFPERFGQDASAPSEAASPDGAAESAPRKSKFPFFQGKDKNEPTD